MIVVIFVGIVYIVNVNDNGNILVISMPLCRERWVKFSCLTYVYVNVGFFYEKKKKVLLRQAFQYLFQCCIQDEIIILVFLMG